ncbi:hypothetical protein IGJ55_000314 [Enterococcus sp. AZ170]
MQTVIGTNYQKSVAQVIIHWLLENDNQHEKVALLIKKGATFFVSIKLFFYISIQNIFCITIRPNFSCCGIKIFIS